MNTTQSDEIVRTLRNNPEMEWTMEYDGEDLPAMLIWWLKGETRKTYARFALNGRIKMAHGVALGFRKYSDAGNLSAVCADISSRARATRCFPHHVVQPCLSCNPEHS